MQHGPFEDVFPIGKSGFHGYVSLPQCILVGKYTHTIHVWYMNLHLVDFYDKFR